MKNRVCSVCGKPVPEPTTQENPDGLLAVRKEWRTIGKPSRTVRARTLRYVCQLCAEADPDWNREPYKDSPGNAP